ncbi:MAG: hypothetical protein R3B70_22990 [Polyangiaceae bacterium]
MKRIFSAAAVLSVVAAIGCSPALTQSHAVSSAAEADAPAAETDAKSTAKAETSAKADDAAADATEAAAADETAAAEKAAPAPWGTGDYVVYRFTGSFHKTAITLTEKVIARQGDAFTLDVTYDDGKTRESIRARMRGESPARAEVLGVTKLVRGVEQPASAALFDELLARVALVADQNEARLGSESVSLDIAGHGSVACEQTTFRVKVGAETATMKTIESAAFAWGDLGAEITAASGKLIYKAEVVDAGHEAAKAPALASADDDFEY